MSKTILTLLVLCMTVFVPKLWAQSSNTDFNPFPQMEQDQAQTDNDTSAKADEDNQDQWPPVNNDTPANSGEEHE